ncbi:CarD family transcriptional regulator [Candidatus Saccharibacteria bacterium]|nr:CarD family transcriptional regulator [Candidatus Saccharibacteria bacterium]
MYRRSVCTVCEIIENFRDQGRYYRLVPHYDSSLVIHAPVDSPEGFFRPLLTKQEVDKLINSIPDVKCLDVGDRLLENAYKDLFNSEKHDDLICIIKTAYLHNEQRIQGGQRRSEKDRIYFQKAEQALYGELAVSLGKTIDETRDYIVERVGSLTA